MTAQANKLALLRAYPLQVKLFLVAGMTIFTLLRQLTQTKACFAGLESDLFVCLLDELFYFSDFHEGELIEVLLRFKGVVFA